MHKVAVIGASGFAGAELLRICATHRSLDVAVATADSMAGMAVKDLYPNLAVSYPDNRFVGYEPGLAAGCDLAFLALPHGASQHLVPQLRNEVDHIVDLAADFRLDDPDLYPVWYSEAHSDPLLLAEFVYGLPELNREPIRGARLVAAPGCYVTAAVLALAPLLERGAIEPRGIVVNAASGVSGAGRPPKPHTTFCTVDENFTAYGLLTHRHTPEIEMGLTRAAGTTAQVLFTPHLVPMNRGILATCYARPHAPVATDDVLGILEEAYAHEPFVVVSEQLPSTKATLGSNDVHITARVDRRTGWVIVISALDNLVKGAAGQAVQCANLALGFDETEGLAVAGLYP